MINKAPSQEAILEAESAIHQEVRRMQLEYAELSPVIRELLAKCYIRGGIDAVEKIKKDRKELLENSPTDNV